ncbi:MAG TPA: helix-turn-helix domain-containing protein [Pyrinomonadaceae bacterium]|jgi:tetratricopeptide (TPR) repeat protein
MDIQASLVRQLENPKLSRVQRAELRCQLAKQLEDAGDYEAARQAMGEFWQRIGDPPNVKRLEASTAAEVLLRAGVLTGWIGSKNQITGAQEIAKNLISESLTIFESHRHLKKVAEAQTELACCYWREGALDEARVILKEALSRLTTDSELKAKAVLRSAIVEWSALRYNDSLQILKDAAPLFGKIKSHTIKGGYHNALAGVLEDTGTKEQREDYTDRAFVEYTAASFHFEQAGHKSYRANVENNLGYLYFKVRRFRAAHEHLDRAKRLLTSLKDFGGVAQVDETRARVFLSEGRNVEAERAARAAVSTLLRGGQQALVAEALITHGRALARLSYYSQAYSAFERAIKVAQAAGEKERAGDAALAIIEELGEHLTFDKAQATFSGYGLEEILRRYEKDVIKEALITAQGSVTQAARLLGVSHQRLIYIVEKKHKDLRALRTPAKRRPKQ